MTESPKNPGPRTGKAFLSPPVWTLGGALIGAGLVWFITYVAKLPNINKAATTPVVVGGGAMTIRTIEPGGWQPINGGAGGYCADIPAPSSPAPSISTINFDGVDTWIKPHKSVASQDVSSGWSLTIYGRKYPYPQGSDDPSSSNGIQLTQQTQSCSGAQGANSILLALAPKSPSAAFYPDDDGSINEEASSSPVVAKRFQDTNTTSCLGPTGSAIDSTTKLPQGDEDVCERGSKIEIVTGTGSTVDYRCIDGECKVSLQTK